MDPEMEFLDVNLTKEFTFAPCYSYGGFYLKRNLQYIYE